MIVSLCSLLVSPEQQSVHAKEATEDMEVAILKTCQSINDLRREVSSSPSPLFCPSALSRSGQTWPVTERLSSLSVSHCFLNLAAIPCHGAGSTLENPHAVMPGARLFLPLVFHCSLPPLLPSHSLIFDSSRSSIRSRSVAPQTCSKFTGSSCLCAP